MPRSTPRDTRGRFVSRRRSNTLALLIAQIGTAASLTAIAVAVVTAVGGLLIGAM